jgi:Xaa-Pro aminopeptidase
MYPHQAERLTAVAERHGLDAVVAVSAENVRYVTGFASAVESAYRDHRVFGVFTRQGTGLVLPVIDAVTLADDPADVDVVVPYGAFTVEPGTGELGRRLGAWMQERAADPTDALRRALTALGAASGVIGVDEGGLTVSAWNALAPLSPRPSSAALAEARMVKSPYEIEAIARALHVAEQAANAVMQILKPGMTEREAAVAFQEDVVRRGGTPYLTLIGFGPRAGLPASVPSIRSLRSGDLVRLDLGAVVDGYRCDVGRTAVMGAPAARQERLYEAIAAGHERAIDSLRAGETGAQVFDTTVAATRAAGLDQYARHHVGHGVGLAHWEAPVFAPGDTTPLEAGMVVQVENAWYELGWGGVHLKDTLLVTRGGAQSMNRSARGLVVLD